MIPVEYSLKARARKKLYHKSDFSTQFIMEWKLNQKVKNEIFVKYSDFLSLFTLVALANIKTLENILTAAATHQQGRVIQVHNIKYPIRLRRRRQEL